jgi:hypothetical protein
MAILTAAAFSTAQAAPGDGTGGGSKGEGKLGEIKNRILKKYDIDGDGVLSDTEKNALKADRAAMLVKYDADKDGKLSEAERAAIPKPEKKPGEKK